MRHSKRAVLLVALCAGLITIALSATTASGTVCSSASPQYCPNPTVTTGSATVVTGTSEKLNGTVTAGAPATCSFLVTGKGVDKTVTASPSPTTTTTSTPETAIVPGLTPGIQYTYQLQCAIIGGPSGSGKSLTFIAGTSNSGGGGGGGGGGGTGTSPTSPTNPTNPTSQGGGSGGASVTVAPSNIGSTTATLNGYYNASGSFVPQEAGVSLARAHIAATGTSCHFDYGTTPQYGTSTPAQTVTASGYVSANVTNLKPATTYHYELVCVSSAGYAYGGDTTFTTAGGRCTITNPHNCAGPSVFTGRLTRLTRHSAVVHGYVNPNGASATCSFHYGIGKLRRATKGKHFKAGTRKIYFSARLRNLKSNRRYGYQLVCKSASATDHGAKRTFKTK